MLSPCSCSIRTHSCKHSAATSRAERNLTLRRGNLIMQSIVVRPPGTIVVFVQRCTARARMGLPRFVSLRCFVPFAMSLQTWSRRDL